MKPFKFSLESVLEHRQHLENEKAVLFERTQQAVQRIEQAIFQLEKETEQMVRYLNSGHLFKTTDIQQFYRYQEDINTRLVEQRHQLAVAHRKRKFAHKDWLKARQDVQAIEKLKEKQYTQHLQQLSALEAKELDDFLVTRHPQN